MITWSQLTHVNRPTVDVKRIRSSFESNRTINFMQEILLLDNEIGDTFYLTNYYLWCFLSFFLQTRISYFRIFLMLDSKYQVNLLLYTCSSPSMSFYAEIWLQEVTVLVPIRGPLLRSMTYGSRLFRFHKWHCHYLNLMVCFNRLYCLW